MFVRSSKMFPRSAYQRVYLNSKDALYSAYDVFLHN